MAKLDKLAEEITGEQNTYCFDGLYKNCYIRLEADEMSDLLKALNLLYK